MHICSHLNMMIQSFGDADDAHQQICRKLCKCPYQQHYNFMAFSLLFLHISRFFFFYRGLFTSRWTFLRLCVSYLLWQLMNRKKGHRFSRDYERIIMKNQGKKNAWLMNTKYPQPMFAPLHPSCPEKTLRKMHAAVQNEAVKRYWYVS